MRRFITTSAALLVLASGCGGEDLVDRPPPTRYVDKIPQIKASKIDVLFVIDDSGSMLDEQKALSSNFESFLRYLDPNPATAGEDGEVDYRLAVTTVSSGNAGELVGDVVKVVRPGAAYDPLATFQSNVVVGVNGTAHEEGLRMAELALMKAAKVFEGGQQQFLRPNAYLYVVFVTDEEDVSFGEVVYYLRRYVELKGPGSQNAVKVSAIVGLPDGSCETANPGERYAELVDRSGGELGSICTENWADTLKRLSVSGIGLRKEFPLTYPPKDLDQPGFNDPQSQDILVEISYPCEKDETGEYVNKVQWEACAPLEHEGRLYRFDECADRLPSELGLTCIPYHDELNGWIYDEESHALRFAQRVLPQAGGLVTARYFKRDER